jgi:hypothetical protein
LHTGLIDHSQGLPVAYGVALPAGRRQLLQSATGLPKVVVDGLLLSRYDPAVVPWTSLDLTHPRHHPSVGACSVRLRVAVTGLPAVHPRKRRRVETRLEAALELRMPRIAATWSPSARRAASGCSRTCWIAGSS